MEKRRRAGDGARPPQPDGISNIHSWNVRNAGQSDLTERRWGGRERVLDNDRL